MPSQSEQATNNSLEDTTRPNSACTDLTELHKLDKQAKKMREQFKQHKPQTFGTEVAFEAIGGFLNDLQSTIEGLRTKKCSITKPLQEWRDDLRIYWECAYDNDWGVTKSDSDTEVVEFDTWMADALKGV